MAIPQGTLTDCGTPPDPSRWVGPTNPDLVVECPRRSLTTRPPAAPWRGGGLFPCPYWGPTIPYVPPPPQAEYRYARYIVIRKETRKILHITGFAALGPSGYHPITSMQTSPSKENFVTETYGSWSLARASAGPTTPVPVSTGLFYERMRTLRENIFQTTQANQVLQLEDTGSDQDFIEFDLGSKVPISTIKIRNFETQNLEILRRWVGSSITLLDELRYPCSDARGRG